MRGVVFTGDRTLDFVSFDDPVPGPGEVVLEIKASGLCGSDLKFYRASKAGGFQALGFKGATWTPRPRRSATASWSITIAAAACARIAGPARHRTC